MAGTELKSTNPFLKSRVNAMVLHTPQPLAQVNPLEALDDQPRSGPGAFAQLMATRTTPAALPPQATMFSPGPTSSVGKPGATIAPPVQQIAPAAPAAPMADAPGPPIAPTTTTRGNFFENPITGIQVEDIPPGVNPEDHLRDMKRRADAGVPSPMSNFIQTSISAAQKFNGENGVQTPHWVKDDNGMWRPQTPYDVKMDQSAQTLQGISDSLPDGAKKALIDKIEASEPSTNVDDRRAQPPENSYIDTTTGQRKPITQ